MGSHSVTCHPTQVNTPRLSPAMQAGTRFTYPKGMEGWVDLVDLMAPRPGIEPAAFRSRVRRQTAAPVRPSHSESSTDRIDAEWRQCRRCAESWLGCNCHTRRTWVNRAVMSDLYQARDQSHEPPQTADLYLTAHSNQIRTLVAFKRTISNVNLSLFLKRY